MTNRLERYRLRIADDRTTWQALRTWTLYRMLVGVLLVGLFFTPILGDLLPAAAAQLARIVSGSLLVAAPALYLLATQYPRRPGLQTLIGCIVDLTTTGMILQSVGGAASCVGTLLVGSMVLVGAILPARIALLYASIASMVVLWQALEAVLLGTLPATAITSAGAQGAVYLLTALIGSYLAGRARESQAIARQRSTDLANLAELNELIIERMRTGIMIIDENDNAHLMNEAAWYLAGMPDERTAKLSSHAPRLRDDLDEWRQRKIQPEQPLKLQPGIPPILPRFAALSGDPRGDVLVFLEDTSMLSRRAQELTLASLGRLSASIAHEIRNPLGAISHSAQLLEESPELGAADKRLTSIIVRHCDRMDDIIENVLHLARQERCRPTAVRLDRWLEHFVDEFRRFHEVGSGHLELRGTDPDAWILIDGSQFQQVMWNLCQNALRHGRKPGEGARVTIDWSRGGRSGVPWLEVCDEGPGIPEADRERIFEPFFTSRTDGSGLGLYLCQQLMEANQGTISYEHDDEGSRFRLEFARSPAPAQEDRARPVAADRAGG